MKIVSINLNKISKEIISEIADYINRGKIIAYPTDTIYGLGCDALNRKAIKKIFRIKKRNEKKPLLMLANNFNIIKKYCLVNKQQIDYLKKIWPAPITVILKRKKNTIKDLAGADDSLAIRIPDNNFLKLLLKKLKRPITSTSLNISGEKNFNNPKNIEIYFIGLKPDIVIDAGNIFIPGKPSKIIDIRDIKNIKIIRK